VGENYRDMIQAFLIDLFDTLVHIDEEGYLAWRGEMAGILGLPAGEFQEWWMSLAPERFTGRIRNTSRMLDLAAERFNREISGELHALLVRRELQVLLDHSFLYAGTLEALREMGSAGYRKALVSNASANARPLLSHLGLDILFDELIISCEAGIAKPDPAIYRLALSKLGLAADECLFVGDGACQELDGARQAVMGTVRIVQEPQSKLLGSSEHADFTIGALREAIGVAREIDGGYSMEFRGRNGELAGGPAGEGGLLRVRPAGYS